MRSPLRPSAPHGATRRVRLSRPTLALSLLLLLGLAHAIPGCGGSNGAPPDDAGTNGDAGDPGVPVNMGAPDILTDAEPVAGFQFLETSYTVPGTGEERTIRLNVWYATNDTEGTSTRFNALSVDANSYLDASVRVPSGQAPLMVYSHGDRAWGGSNFRLARQFVRNGWIVVAPDHTGNTALDNILPRAFEYDMARAYDMRATIDAIENLPSTHPLAGHVATSRVLVAGHSYGGHTAWLVDGAGLDLTTIEASCAPDCVEAELDAFRMFVPDTRIVGAIALDGGVGTDRVADAGFADMTGPMLFMTPTNDAGDMALYDRSALADVTWVQLDGACHESFTGTFSCQTLPLTTSLPITHTYAVAFGIRTVLQSDDAALLAILDGTTEVDPVVTFSRHIP